MNHIEFYLSFFMLYRSMELVFYKFINYVIFNYNLQG